MAKHGNKEVLESDLSFMLSQYEEIYGRNNEEAKPNQRFMRLIKRAYNQTGKKVVVLIDEYDAPLLDVMHEEEQLPVLRNIMRSFYSPLKDCDPMLRFVFITGITKFSQLSIFSELNNIFNISMMPEYAGVCGITESEMLGKMSDDIERMAEAQGWTVEETIKELKGNTHYEGHWQQMLYVIFSMLGAHVDVEVRTSNGHIDLVALTAHKLYIVELKLNKSAEAAMNQIDLKSYPDRFALCRLLIVKVGVNFDIEKRNITEWKIESV